MTVEVQLYSYFKDLAGAEGLKVEVPAGSTLGDLLGEVFKSAPRMKAMERSLLIAVGVEYQNREYVLQEGDEVSLFPPVQGG